MYLNDIRVGNVILGIKPSDPIKELTIMFIGLYFTFLQSVAGSSGLHLCRTYNIDMATDSPLLTSSATFTFYSVHSPGLHPSPLNLGKTTIIPIPS